MPVNEALLARVRSALTPVADVSERKMFGGVAFMVAGNMCCGVNKDHLMLRVGADGYDEALGRPHARPMDFTGRPMKGMVFVDPPGFAGESDLRAWIDLALRFVRTLPAK